MAIPIQSQIYNPISGVFGTGQMQFFGPNSTATSWSVPAGIGKVRARCWGGSTGTNSGGFAIKSIYDLTGVSTIPIIVSTGTCSFGSYVSSTGGSSSGVGTGVGGDINSNGTTLQVGNLLGSPNGFLGGASAYTSAFPGQFSIDFIGCGAISNGYSGTFPGGTGSAVYGLVIVEW